MFNILWLEDKPETVSYEYGEISIINNCYIEMVEWPAELLSRLESRKKKYDLLLLDIMIPQIKSFKKGEEEYRTRNGLATGLVYYGSVIKDKFDGSVIFFTARDITEELKNEVGKYPKCKLIPKEQFKTTLLPYLQSLIQKEMGGVK